MKVKSSLYWNDWANSERSGNRFYALKCHLIALSHTHKSPDNDSKLIFTFLKFSWLYYITTNISNTQFYMWLMKWVTNKLIGFTYLFKVENNYTVKTIYKTVVIPGKGRSVKVPKYKVLLCGDDKAFVVLFQIRTITRNYKNGISVVYYNKIQHNWKNI